MISKKQIFIGATASILLILAGSLIGSYRAGIEETFQALLFPADNNILANIIYTSRVPRSLAAYTCGSVLAVSGVVYQCIFRNIMADPYILGVSSAAALGSVVSIVFGITFIAGLYVLPLFSFIFAILAVLFVIALSKGQRTLMILVGIAVSLFCASIISLLSFLDLEKLKDIYIWSLGSFANASYTNLTVIVLGSLPIVILAIKFIPEMDLLLLGETSSKALGVNVNLVVMSLLISSTIAVAISVAEFGIIGFIGLIIPHLCRAFTGYSHKKLVYVSMFVGGFFLLASDILSRLIIPNVEIPIGLITTVIGAPYFVIILLKRRYI